MADSSFRVGGLASGLDTNALIDSLVKIESRPLELIAKKQKAFQSQMSTVADLVSKLGALKDATAALGTDGTLGMKVSSTNTSYSATASSAASAGSYAVKVDTVAVAAKARSTTAFTSGLDTVTGGSLSMTVMGKDYVIDLDDGTTLRDLAATINASGAPVNAAVMLNNGAATLSLTNRDTGHPVGEDPSTALTIVEHYTGVKGRPLGFVNTQSAANATFSVDGVSFERSSNEVSDALTGVTLSLKSSGAAEDLVLRTDADATAKNVQKFVDAYNAVASLVQKQLAVTQGTDRTSTLAGDSSVRTLQRRLQQLVGTPVAGLAGAVQSMADLGIQTNRDGTLKLDSTRLGTAISKDAGGVNALFSKASTGLAAAATDLWSSYSNSTSGILVQRQNSLKRQMDGMDADAVRAQLRVDAFRDNLVRQFSAMESVVSGLKAVSSFLDSQSAKSSK